ncbi:hypothetical protein [Sphingomonas caeni]|uniref:hypothetical protein n=1 Tax=Sphingomonas caeni TaxID=2984949 RepID=UPI00222FDCB0|nr:hypothetical protein [Sphingomonas caeni]
MKDRATFLDHLAGSCNVTAAAKAAGVSTESAYALRRREEAFAAEWHAALLAGYAVLETALLGHALGRSDDGTVAMPFGKLDFEAGLRLLAQHRATLTGKAYRGGPPLKRATRQETDMAILKKIEMIERARKAGVA